MSTRTSVTTVSAVDTSPLPSSRVSRSADGANLSAALRDLVALTKPGITVSNTFLTVAAMAIAPSSVALLTVFLAVVGTLLIIASANALNMVLERDRDKLMTRTADRPIPAGRLGLGTSLVFGGALGVVGLGLLFATNLITGVLGAAAMVFYLLLYTPLKPKTPHAVLVGAVAGAAPPLLGWTAVMGTVAGTGSALFLWLFVWQVPHFLAISLYRRTDYPEAGFKTVPVVYGERVAKRLAVAFAALLIPVSLLPVLMGTSGFVFGGTATVFGLAFLYVGALGLRDEAGPAWARRFFASSIIYLMSLTAMLVVDTLI